MLRAGIILAEVNSLFLKETSQCQHWIGAIQFRLDDPSNIRGTGA